jgi:hypothetical protein
MEETKPSEIEAAAGAARPRCSDCGLAVGEQHRPSCHRQGMVTPASDYRGYLEPAAGTDVTDAAAEPKTWNERHPDFQVPQDFEV